MTTVWPVFHWRGPGKQPGLVGVFSSRERAEAECHGDWRRCVLDPPIEIDTPAPAREGGYYPATQGSRVMPEGW